MEQTTHFHLNKPEKSDYAKIQPISENMDIIDSQLKAAQDHRNNADIHVTAAQKTTWNEKVPQTRTINGQPLSADIDLDAEDVGAADAETLELVVENIGNMKNEFSEHIGNNDVHVIAGEKILWNQNIVHQLNYSKSGTVHQLTGLTGLSGTLSCVFKATAAFAAGDTFTVDGVAYAVQLSNGEAAEDNLFVSGASLTVVVDTAGKKVNFKKAGGRKLPAGTVVLKTTVSTTFVVPETGNYKITVVGHGGQGGMSAIVRNDPYYAWANGGGGGSGGIALGTFKLKKGQNITVTVTDAISSFGSLISATAGQKGDYWYYYNYGGWKQQDGGAGGIGSGGDYSSPGQRGLSDKVYEDSDEFIVSTGGSGGAYTVTNKNHISFLSTTRLRGNKYDRVEQDPVKNTDVGLGHGGQCSLGYDGEPGANGLVLVERA